MAILLSKDDGTLVPATETIKAAAAIEIGKPIGISLLSFFPGTIKKDWGGKAEIMITSEIRFGPLNEAAPRRINMVLQGYDYMTAPVISDYGGDVYGDPMLYYSKAYAGQRVGMTLRGVEVDKFDAKTWKGIDTLLSTVGSLTLFTPAVPYLGYIAVAKNIAAILMKAIARNDRLQTSRADLYFEDANKKVLQTGRYIIWEPQQGASPAVLMKSYKLSGTGATEPNQLVSNSDNSQFKIAPYFVIQVDPKARKAYEDFEIGAGSAKLLENLGDQPLGSTILDTVQQLSEQINDARQLAEIEEQIRALKKATTDEDKQKIKKIIKAHSDLFTKNNSELLNELLNKYMQ